MAAVLRRPGRAAGAVVPPSRRRELVTDRAGRPRAVGVHRVDASPGADSGLVGDPGTVGPPRRRQASPLHERVVHAVRVNHVNAVPAVKREALAVRGPGRRLTRGQRRHAGAVTVRDVDASLARPVADEGHATGSSRAGPAVGAAGGARLPAIAVSVTAARGGRADAAVRRAGGARLPAVAGSVAAARGGRAHPAVGRAGGARLSRRADAIPAPCTPRRCLMQSRKARVPAASCQGRDERDKPVDPDRRRAAARTATNRLSPILSALHSVPHVHATRDVDETCASSVLASDAAAGWRRGTRQSGRRSPGHRPSSDGSGSRRRCASWRRRAPRPRSRRTSGSSRAPPSRSSS